MLSGQIHIYIYIYIYICVCLSVCLCLCMCVCVRACVHACVCVFVAFIMYIYPRVSGVRLALDDYMFVVHSSAIQLLSDRTDVL